MRVELNPRFTFDAFVVGGGNKLAATAARAVAQTPGSVYNPLYINGGPGLGKTHLLMAIGHVVQQHRPSAEVEYLTPEALSDSFHAAVSAGQSDAYRHRLAGVDILLFDDVDGVAHRHDVQAELLRALSELLAAGRQVVLAANCPPTEIKGVDRPLAARLSGGLVVNLTRPDRDTRLEILRQRSDERGCRFRPDVLETVAGLEFLSVRELVSALNRLVALQAFSETDLTPEAVQALLEGDIAPTRGAAPLGGSRATSAGSGDQFADFLSGVSSTVQKQVEVWEARLGSAIERWSQLGFQTTRLESLLQQPDPVPVEAAIEEFERDVEQLMELRNSIAQVDPDRVADPVFSDPDRVADARAMVEGLVPGGTPLLGPSRTWTFDNLLVSEANQAAVEGARALVAAPAAAAGPLLLVGPTGVGKTHLLHAIGNALAEALGGSVACLSAQDFVDGELEARQAGSLDAWRRNYDAAVAVLVDDLHLVSGKVSAEEELLALMGRCADSGRPMVCTMNSEPREVGGLNPQLGRRLEGGRLASIEAPDRGLRRNLVLEELQARGTEADAELAEYLAARPADSVRAVKGLVQRVLEAADAQGVPPDAALARQLVEGSIPRLRRSTSRMRTSGIVATPASGVRSHEKFLWAWPDPSERLLEELK